MTRARRAVAAAALGAALAGALAGCSKDANTVQAQADSGDRKGYTSGDGSVQYLPPDKRGDPLTLAGPTVDGGRWDLGSVTGKVVVINVWASWCPPCVAETPELQRTWDALRTAGKPVVFVGINAGRESDQTARTFLERNGVTYPSLSADGGNRLLDLQGKANALPATLILDPAHRVAARVNGATTQSTLTGLVDDVLAGGS